MNSIYSTPGFPLGFLTGFAVACGLFLAVGCTEIPIKTKDMIAQIKECKDAGLKPVAWKGFNGRIYDIECQP